MAATTLDRARARSRTRSIAHAFARARACSRACGGGGGAGTGRAVSPPCIAHDASCVIERACDVVAHARSRVAPRRGGDGAAAARRRRRRRRRSCRAATATLSTPSVGCTARTLSRARDCAQSRDDDVIARLRSTPRHRRARAHSCRARTRSRNADSAAAAVATTTRAAHHRTVCASRCSCAARGTTTTSQLHCNYITTAPHI